MKDRILLVMMGILMAQVGVTMLHLTPGVVANQEVDIVVRTTTASIFGYFLGSTFLSTKGEEPSPQERQRQHQQLLLVGGLGIFFLLLFLLGRNLATVHETTNDFMAQLRDFISGSVGMLIGHGGRGGDEA